MWGRERYAKKTRKRVRRVANGGQRNHCNTSPSFVARLRVKARASKLRLLCGSSCVAGRPPLFSRVGAGRGRGRVHDERKSTQVALNGLMHCGPLRKLRMLKAPTELTHWTTAEGKIEVATLRFRTSSELRAASFSIPIIPTFCSAGCTAFCERAQCGATPQWRSPLTTRLGVGSACLAVETCLSHGTIQLAGPWSAYAHTQSTQAISSHAQNHLAALGLALILRMA